MIEAQQMPALFVDHGSPMNAVEANDGFKKMILEEQYDQLSDISTLISSSAYRLAIPTREHYLPLLYILGLKENEERIEFFNDKLVMGSLAMTSLMIR